MILENLEKSFTLKDITLWADYSGTNASRDFRALKTHRDRKGKWDIIIAALKSNGYNVEDFLKKK